MISSAHKTKWANRTQNMRFDPCSFTGKERDKETGYGYFGARYMDYELMTMWLSVDPLADKYPSISPYAYCAWNPVKLIDPDGKEFGDYYSEKGKYLGSDGIADKRMYVAFGDNDKIISQINNKDFSFEHQYLCNSDVFLEMFSYVTKSNENCDEREYGGSIFCNDAGGQKVYYCKPGPKYSSGDHFASIITNEWAEDYNFEGMTLVLKFHTHFRGLDQFPSPEDKSNIYREGTKERMGGATCPYNVLFAMASRQVHFYNDSGTVFQWPFYTVNKKIKTRYESE